MLAHHWLLLPSCGHRCQVLLLLVWIVTVCPGYGDETASQISHIGEVKVRMCQRTELQVGPFKIGLEKTCFIEVRVLKVTFSHIRLLESSLIEVAVFGNDAEQVNALHRGTHEVALADVCCAEGGRAQITLTEIALDQDCLIKADLSCLTVVHIAPSHVRIVEAHVAQVHARQAQARHLERLNRGVDNLEELCHSQLYRIPLSDLIKLGYQGLYPVEADLFIEFIDQLLVVHG